MNPDIKKLIYTYFIFAALKFIISLFVFAPLGFADSYIYLRIAKSIISDHSFFLDGGSYSIYPPLYSLIISIANVFKDMNVIIMFIKLINSLLISTIIFPIYFLAREFVSEKNAIWAGILTSIIPPFVVLPAYILSENLFYPLFVFSLFFLYKSFTSPAKRWDILAGVFIGLGYLTKMSGVILVVLALASIILFWHIKLYKKPIKNTACILLSALIVSLPWLIHNGLTYGFNTPGILGQYADQLPSKVGVNLFQRMYWALLHLDYAILASGIIFFILTIIILSNKEDIKLRILGWIVFLSAILYSLLAGAHSGGYPNWRDAIPHGRYLEMVLPLILVVGYIAWEKDYVQRIKWQHICACLLLFIIGMPLTAFALFPVNNISLVYFGILSKLSIMHWWYQYLIAVLFAASPLSILIFKKISLKKSVKIFGIFYLLVSIMGVSVVMYSSNHIWYNYEISKMGRWIDANIDKNEIIVYDEEIHPFSGKAISKNPEKSYVLYPGMWFTNKIITADADKSEWRYLISSQQMDYTLLYETEWKEDKIRLYER